MESGERTNTDKAEGQGDTVMAAIQRDGRPHAVPRNTHRRPGGGDNAHPIRMHHAAHKRVPCYLLNPKIVSAYTYSRTTDNDQPSYFIFRSMYHTPERHNAMKDRYVSSYTQHGHHRPSQWRSVAIGA